MPPEGADRSAAITALALFLLALGMRSIATLRIEVMFDDGPRFIGIAKLMAEGNWLQAFGDDYHPLYSFLIFLVHGVIAHWDSAAVVVSVVAGSTAAVAVYFFVSACFDARSAWIAGLLAAIHPYGVIFSADVQSEGVYAALFLSSIATLWRAAASRAPRLAFAAGCLAGLAYLTRPEALGVPLIGVGFFALRASRGACKPGAAFRCAAALALGTLLFASPYLVTLRAITGEWSLTQKKSVARVVPFETPQKEAPRQAAPALADATRRVIATQPGSRPEDAALPAQRPGVTEANAETSPPPWRPQGPAASPTGRTVRERHRRESWGPHLASLRELAVNAIGTLRYELVLALALGLYACRGRPSARALFIGGFLTLYGAILYGLNVNYGYISRRHAFPPLMLLLGYAAVGVPVIGRTLLTPIRRFLPDTPAARSRAAIAIGLLAIATLAVPKALAQRGAEDVDLRLAAAWLRAQPELRGPVAATRRRVAYYAGEAFVSLDVLDHSRGLDGLIAAGARFLIVDASDRQRIDAVLRTGPDSEQLRPLHRIESEEGPVIVFELRARPE